MPETWYTPQDVARMINRSANTVRFYSQEFEEFLSPYVERTPGQHRRYSPDALNIFRLIVYCLEEGRMTIDAAKDYIRKSIEAKAGLPGGVELVTADQLKTIAQFTASVMGEVRALRADVESLATLQTQVEEMNDLLRQLLDKERLREQEQPKREEELARRTSELAVEQMIMEWRREREQKRRRGLFWLFGGRRD